MKRLLFSPIIIIIVFALILVAVWFRHGLIMGTAESGVSFYNISTLELKTRYTWTQMNLGASTDTLPAVWPHFVLFVALSRLGVPGFLIQAATFYFILVSSGVSIFYLTKLLFPRTTNISGLIAVFFYWFNPLITVNVWNRFLLDLTFGYAFLPLALYILLRGIEKRKYIYTLIFGIVSVVFSFAFASLVEMLLIWGILFITTFYYFVIAKRKDKFFVMKFFILLFVFFCLVNLWWLSQVIYITHSPDFGRAVSQFASTLGNLDNLISVTTVLGNLSNMFRFAHSSYFALSSFWTNLFQSFPAVILEYSVTGLIILSIVLFRKRTSLLFLALLMFLGIFLMKGNYPPLGEIFQYFFISFSPLQLFRNPFEKFSIMVVLPAAIIFAFSFQHIIIKLKNRSVRLTSLFLVFFVLLFLWGYPLWTGSVFSDPGTDSARRQSFEIEVPEYYKEAADWLKEQPGDFRFLSLPMADEGVIYTWEHPYRGIDLTFLLLPTPNISNITTVSYFNMITGGIDKSFVKLSGFGKVIEALNIKYILLRKDIEWQFQRVRDPDIVLNILESVPYLSKIKEFDQLSFWENESWKEKFIYASSKYIISLPSPDIFDLGLDEASEDSILVTPGTGSEYLQVVHPSHKLHFSNIPDSKFEIDQDIFPYVSTLPSSKIYPLVIIKEKLNLYTVNDSIKRTELLTTLLGKRLVEAKMSSDIGDQKAQDMALSNYVSQLAGFEKSIMNLSNSKLTWRQERMATVFAKHLNIINQLKGDSRAINEVKQKVEQMLIRDHIMPQHNFIVNDDYPLIGRDVYQIEVQKSGKYSISLNTVNWFDYYNSLPNYVQIDDNLYPITLPINQDGVTKLGEYDLGEGLHELSYDSPGTYNLIDTQAQFDLTVDHDQKDLSFNIENFDSYATYKISFNYFIEKGSGFQVYFNQDNDPVSNGKTLHHFSKNFTPDSYDFGEKSFSVEIEPSNNSTSAELAITASPSNNCIGVFQKKGAEKCKNPDFSYAYDRSTKVVFKNLRVVKVLNTEPYLTSFSEIASSQDNPKIGYTQISPTSYIVSVSKASHDFMLVFSELFNSGWKATYGSGENIADSDHHLVNGYANGWLVNKRGDYQVALNYSPQKQLELSKIISAISFCVGIVLIFASYLWRKHHV